MVARFEGSQVVMCSPSTLAPPNVRRVPATCARCDQPEHRRGSGASKQGMSIQVIPHCPRLGWELTTLGAVGHVSCRENGLSQSVRHLFCGDTEPVAVSRVPL